jgi:hypothetical protein
MKATGKIIRCTANVKYNGQIVEDMKVIIKMIKKWIWYILLGLW